VDVVVFFVNHKSWIGRTSGTSGDFFWRLFLVLTSIGIVFILYPILLAQQSAASRAEPSSDIEVFQNLAIYLTPLTPTCCGLTSFENGTGSI
jgi:hypothetical protein